MKKTTKEKMRKINQERAASWIRLMVKKIGTGFHIDTSFKDYINYKTDKQIFTKREASLFDVRMDNTLKLLGDKVYDIALEAMEPLTKKGRRTMATKKTTKKAKKTNKKDTKAQSKKKANNKKGSGKSIRRAIIDLMMDKGVDKVTPEQCEKIAKGIKKDTAWKLTHYYYYRKIVKGMIEEQRPKRKKVKKGKKGKK